MNEELKKLDCMMCGIDKADFSGLQFGAGDRKEFPYSCYDLAVNLNDLPLQTDTAVIVTSWSGHLGWLKYGLTNYRKTGGYIILAFNNDFYAWNNLDDSRFMMLHLPRPIHYLLAHSVVFKHRTYDADKRVGWYWSVRHAQALIRQLPNIKYVYCTNGDCVLEKPEALSSLPEILKDGDLMSGQSQPGGTIHTACVYYKVEAFHRIMDYMADKHEHSIMADWSPERLLREAVDALNLKETRVQNPLDSTGDIDFYCKEAAPSTWKDVLGFHNLYHEQEYRENNGLEPIDKKYFDSFENYISFRDDWRETICRYYATGDRRYLMMWWDRGKETDTERIYKSLEEYGSEPIYQ